MTIEFKAVQINNPQINKKQEAKFYPRIYNTQKIDLEKMCTDICRSTSLNALTIKHVLVAMEYQIADYMQNGNSVNLPGIGTIYPSISGNPSETIEEVNADDIKKVNINFRPSKKLKKAVRLVKFKKVSQTF
ncbi:HU family DNA-binding protein [Ancylomarina sp. DW003]|nr:DNA-binding domain-containing protein [Ancylomarina sp. DW003]MDE5421151.1 HU family DNA-binding protein [Ancylomarina sp. DW003]